MRGGVGVGAASDVTLHGGGRLESRWMCRPKLISDEYVCHLRAVCLLAASARRVSDVDLGAT